MLPLRAAHHILPGGVERLHLDGFGLVHQHAVGNDLCVQARRTEFLRDVFGGFAVFGRGGQMRLGGKGLQLLAGQLCIRHGQKLLFDLRFLAEIGVAEHGGLRVRFAPELAWKQEAGQK